MEEWNEQEWRRKLESCFTERGLVGGGLRPVLQAEQAHKDEVVVRYNNFNYISDSFLSFFLETLELAEGQRRASTRDTTSYGSVLLSFVVAFRQFRAAQNTALTGYPQQAYALLRDLKDRAIELAACADGLTNYERISGLQGIQIEKYGDSLSSRLALKRRITAARRKEVSRIRKLMFGESSGLSVDDQAVLDVWAELFHQEIHGARITRASIGSDWVRGVGPLPILPLVDEMVMSLYHTHATELAWMIHRTLPFLQLSQSAFPSSWSEKWAVLDSCHRDFVVALMDGKPHAVIPAFIRWVDLKFSLSPSVTFYTEG